MAWISDCGYLIREKDEETYQTMSSKKTTMDMTTGALLPLIIRFTIPLVLGNLLQLTYNAVDGIVVGRFVGDEALAAVGTSNPLMTLIILFVQGICLGASVLIGTLYGAGDTETLKRQVSTAMIAGLVFSAAMTVLSVVFAPELLGILQVDESIMSEAVVYLRIVMCGLVFNFIYNFFASTLRAMGDSKSPLYFLAVSAVLNILGDLVLVTIIPLGIVGCALATVLSEAVSGVLCWIYIKKKIPELNLKKGWLVFDKGLFRQTIQYGLVSALQQSTVQMGKLGIQTMVNTMGVASTAAFAAVNRADDFALIPQHNISHAMMSVMAQNRGAGKQDRIREAFRLGMCIELVYGVIIGVVMSLFAQPIMWLFTKDEAVITLGADYLCLIAWMYIMPAFTNGVQGYFRGIGDLKITLVSSIVNMAVRVISCIPLVFVWNMGLGALPWSYCAGWVAMMIYELPYLIRSINNSRRSTV